MENKVYKPYTKKFFNEEGRFINANGFEWLILKDMFNWLGRLDENNDIPTPYNNKLNKFLENISSLEYRKTFTVLLK